jgi:hypothetical protein
MFVIFHQISSTLLLKHLDLDVSAKSEEILYFCFAKEQASIPLYGFCTYSQFTRILQLSQSEYHSDNLLFPLAFRIFITV